MAQQPPPPQGASGPVGFQAHDWFSYEGYLNVHYGHMERFQREGLILRDGLSFRESAELGSLIKINLRGVIVCVEGVLITVDKWLAVRRNRERRYEVKGIHYSYHAWLRGGQNLIRYCSAHGLPDLHVHRFDPGTGEETEERIALHELPVLGDFILQAVDLGREAVGQRT